MPFISTTTNTEITKDNELALKSRYAKALSLIGKSESYIMLDFVPNHSMYFGGKSDSPIAFVEVKYFGKAGSGSLNSLTAEICSAVSQELGIA